ncbi:NAD-dependent epimerase/dehydratase family protein [Neolewinella persica]|uniref:NAD-dependent epimerase/dehydratase family protein n=1 Tax=Neolewinella persica TaxID=70998 RepID=UPI00035EE897|nr:NAD-dependent epimerase/dehydratase family protein [Neolewinella persica]
MKNTVLITGVLGFVPSSLAIELLQKGYKVVGIDNFLTGSVRNIEAIKDHPDFFFERGDANRFDDLYPLFFDHSPDFVYHYAACVGVKRTLDNPLWVLEDIKGFEAILNLCKDFKVKKTFFSSSSEVYGEPVELPQVENTTPLNSKLPYAVVKNVGEVYFKTWHREYGLNYCIFRFFNTYGPNQSLDFVISKFMRQAILGEPITVYGDGSQTRTFCYIDDNVETTIKAMNHPLLHNEVVNIGSAVITTVLELAELIIRIADSNSEIIHLPPLEEGDMTRRQPANDLMLEVLGRKDLVSLEDGLKRTFAVLKDKLVQVEN